MTKRKSLSYLIEAELEKATVLIAARAITDKLQQIAEQLAKMDANEVMPLGDSMRDLFGSEQASSFEQAVSEKLRALTEQIRNTKNEISDQIDALEKGQPMNDLNNMGDEDMFPDAGGDDAAPMGGEDDGLGGSDMHTAGDEAFGGEADAHAEGGDDFAELDKAFGGADGGAAGRPTKESAKPKGKKLDESSADVRLTKEFAGLIRKGKSPAIAARMIAESYALDVSSVVEIITAVKKG
jgi:hypothetical protein